MTPCNRRNFLASVSCSLAAATVAPLFPVRQLSAAEPEQADLPCWLSVCAPFIVEDNEQGVQSEIILTSDTFAGRRGHEDGKDVTEYEIYLYDADGKAVGAGGIARRLTVPAMHTTVIPIRDLIGDRKSFLGGMTIRLRPHCREKMHASDLFSSAFVRWQTRASFDNVHANPDPLQWQNTQSFYYSMPYPALADYECTFSLFNPYDKRSAGEIVMYDPEGQRVVRQPYDLKPHASLLLDLNTGNLVSNMHPSGLSAGDSARQFRQSGLLAVTNNEGTAKSFGYLMIYRPGRERFSVEHPIHQGVFKPQPTIVPFDERGQFKAKNMLYSPLLFRAKRVGNITLESRAYLGTGLPLEETQWLYPFAMDGAGNAVWSAMKDEKLAACLPEKQMEKGVIRLGTGQSCALDFKRLALRSDFSGGLAVAVSPDTTHTLMKMEVRVPEWGAHAFTHFRPGIRSARSYQAPKQRGGLATDYIVSGAQLSRGVRQMQRDELIGVLNMDDQGREGHPKLEVFSEQGLFASLSLGVIPPFACRHYLLSDLLKKDAGHRSLSLRLVDEQATLLMSAVHLDYLRRDLALDHGSDRFSTFLDYGCR